jgi:hypothetical protein
MRHEPTVFEQGVQLLPCRMFGRIVPSGLIHTEAIAIAVLLLFPRNRQGRTSMAASRNASIATPLSSVPGCRGRTSCIGCGKSV